LPWYAKNQKQPGNTRESLQQSWLIKSPIPVINLDKLKKSTYSKIILQHDPID
jgi:hypothetical protein